MKRAKNARKPFRAGMFLLETLTAGMYNEPLAIYREYIQNAVDSIDLDFHESSRWTGDHPTEIAIHIDPLSRCVRIKDNGIGISNDTAGKMLASVGISDKTGKGLRGFRGIGRLGGIAFCDRAIFRTKSKREKLESVQEWDCRKLKELLSASGPKDLSLAGVFRKITKFYQQNSKDARDSYFEVVLEGVSSFRNCILDYEKVRNYLEQVAPVPFYQENFTCASQIDSFLTSKLKNYRKYNVSLNAIPIFKPYSDIVRITAKRGTDVIKSINSFQLGYGDVSLGWGWYGQRRDLSGAISRGDNVAGIRVRVGNIAIGDSHILDGLFREPRFNSYIVGEIHAEHAGLIPNSRRDDFVDNDTKNLFYNAIEKQIGIPLSKEIRLRSRMYSKETEKTRLSSGEDKKTLTARSPSQGIRTQQLGQLSPNGKAASSKRLHDQVIKKCKGCDKLPGILSLLSAIS